MLCTLSVSSTTADFTVTSLQAEDDDVWKPVVIQNPSLFTLEVQRIRKNRKDKACLSSRKDVLTFDVGIS